MMWQHTHTHTPPPFFCPRDPKAPRRWCLSGTAPHLHATSPRGNREAKRFACRLTEALKRPEGCRCPVCTYAVLSLPYSTSRMNLLAIRESCSFTDCAEQSTDSFTGREGQRNSVLLQPHERCLFSALCLKSSVAASSGAVLGKTPRTHTSFHLFQAFRLVQPGDRYGKPLSWTRPVENPCKCFPGNVPAGSASTHLTPFPSPPRGIHAPHLSHLWASPALKGTRGQETEGWVVKEI